MGQIFGPSHIILTLINMIFQEGTWLWLSNAPFEYMDWGTNQPDNSDPRGENCLGFGHDGTWQWNDENCDRSGTPWNGKTFRPLCQLGIELKTN